MEQRWRRDCLCMHTPTLPSVTAENAIVKGFGPLGYVSIIIIIIIIIIITGDSVYSLAFGEWGDYKTEAT